ncbi:helix-turn-helix transcriptional regulator [Salegentibacter echinorum]|uniref:helix-turn-helix transcriptional regulator n=1 Tax=Salegentibacter echinorum TaxID=1073325 RepID=UPI0011148356
MEIVIFGIGKNPQIAIRLQISPHTVHSAKKNAYRKLKKILKDNYYLLFLFNI